MGTKGRVIITITGPTASGKTSLAVEAAINFKGEVISADSRQIYKHMDIGTSKVKNEETKGVPHYMIDIKEPEEDFTVAEYKKEASKKVEEIQQKGKIPIICGGTGFYIKALIEGTVIPQVPPNQELRRKLEKKSKEELYLELKKLDKRRAEEIEGKNKRKLIRALEIIKETGKPVPKTKTDPPSCPTLTLALDIQAEELERKIEKRAEEMIKEGLEEEARIIFEKNDKLARETIGYAEWEEYLKGETDKEMVKQEIIKNTKKYAKAQMRWFKKEKYITWIKNKEEGIKKIETFLKNKGAL